MKRELYEIRERLESAKQRLTTISRDFYEGAMEFEEVRPAIREVVARDVDEALKKLAYLEERYA